MRSTNNSSETVEWLPNICPNGHRLLRGRALIGWMPCSCAFPAMGHRTIECKTCRATWYHPPHTDDSERVF